VKDEKFDNGVINSVCKTQDTYIALNNNAVSTHSEH